MPIFVYNLLLILFTPLIVLYLFYRRAIGKEDAAHWGERWGDLPRSVFDHRGAPRIWVHAVSVGEVMAAAPILRELRKRWPDAFLLLSTTTIGGREVAMKQCPPADEVVYYPLDFPMVVADALTSAVPDVILLMEWEIWPNFLTTARRRGAKIAVLNGRISDKGLRRGAKSGFFTRPAFRAVDLFAMQSDEDSRRAALVGVDSSKVQTFGNTKFDESVTPLAPEARAALRADLGIAAQAPVWVCGSTRPGEEEIIAAALLIVRESFADIVSIVAPRHLDRADEAAAPFERAGMSVVRRSAGIGPHPPPRFARSRMPSPIPGGNGRKGSQEATDLRPHAPPTVILLDTFGELARVYAIADVAFVGGSLLPFGGQSVFQPLAQGTPTLFGPHMNNQRDIAALARTEGVGFEVRDAPSLAAEVLRLLRLTPTEKDEVAHKAEGLIRRNSGVAARCVDAVAELLAAGKRG